MACDTADYSRTDYIGGSYLFADTYGLLIVSSTKAGKMSHYEDFYGSAANGKCIGKAFKEWFEKNGELDRFCHYGLTILGDPTLRTPRTYNQTRNVSLISVTAGDSLYNTTEVYSSWTVTIKVAVENEGVFTETVNVTAYYNNNTLENQTVNLFPGTHRVLTFIWDTAGVLSCSNYTVSANVSIVPEEIDTGDNISVDGIISVRLMGDVSGDGMTTGLDVLIVPSLANFMKPVPPANPYADVTGDGLVTGLDVLVITSIANFGKACPP
jgi:hypothetical protein